MANALVGIASAYPSHAYQTAATSGELATVHTYCMTVGSFATVSPPWQVERRWPIRIGTVGAGIVSARLARSGQEREGKAAQTRADLRPVIGADRARRDPGALHCVCLPRSLRLVRDHQPPVHQHAGTRSRTTSRPSDRQRKVPPRSLEALQGDRVRGREQSPQARAASDSLRRACKHARHPLKDPAGCSFYHREISSSVSIFTSIGSSPRNSCTSFTSRVLGEHDLGLLDSTRWASSGGTDPGHSSGRFRGTTRSTRSAQIVTEHLGIELKAVGCLEDRPVRIMAMLDDPRLSVPDDMLPPCSTR